MKPVIRVLAIALCLVSFGLVAGSKPANRKTIPFQISTDRDDFELAGIFEGEINTYEGSVEVKLNKVTVELHDVSDKGPTFYNGSEMFSMIEVGLAEWEKDKPGRWRISSNSNVYTINRMMKRGEVLELSDIKFKIPIDSTIDLKSHWIVFTMGSYLPRRNEESLPPKAANSRSYTHSSHDIFR